MNMLAFSWGETTDGRRRRRHVSGSRAARRRSDHSGPHYLQQKGAAAALLLTHGHEDHIGGVPHVLPFVRGPGVRHAAHARAARTEAGRARRWSPSARWCRSGPAIGSPSGPFAIEFIRVTHSMPDCVALAIQTPAGIGGAHRRLQDRPDADRRGALRRPPLRRARQPGVLALFADSTNIDRRGFTGSELDVIEAFEEIFTSATGRLVVAAFVVEHLPDADSRRIWRRSSIARWPSSAAA